MRDTSGARSTKAERNALGLKTEQENKMNSTVEQMAEEIHTALSNGEELDDIRDRSGEWIDSYLPIYNSEIIKEWQVMPSEYDNRGAVEIGHGGVIDIINLMSLDLYLYYYDLFQEAVSTLENKLQEAN